MLEIPWVVYTYNEPGNNNVLQPDIDMHQRMIDYWKTTDLPTNELMLTCLAIKFVSSAVLLSIYPVSQAGCNYHVSIVLGLVKSDQKMSESYFEISSAILAWFLSSSNDSLLQNQKFESLV